MRKYVLDTHLYIDALRDETGAGQLKAFYGAFLPGTYMCSVVVQELLAGVLTLDGRRDLERGMIAPFERRRRILTPSHEAWKSAGELISETVQLDGVDARRIPKSFVNDILLALSCREAGATLVTSNARDFERIRRFAAFEFVEPWPASS